MSTPQNPTAEGVRLLYVGAAAVAVLIGVFFVRDVVAPVFLAITLVLTVRPLVRWLGEHRVPKFLASLVGILVVYLVLSAILFALVIALTQFIQSMPAYAAEFNALYNQAATQLGAWGVSQNMITEWLRTFDYTRILGYATGVLGQLGFWATFLGSLFLFVPFAAVDMTDTTERRSKLALWRPNLAAGLADFSWRVRTYWVVNTIFGLAVALVNMGILAWLQVPLVLTWGILSFVTAYIPNIGFIIGLVPPSLMALLAKGPQTMLILMGLYLTVNFIASMVIQPKVTGDAVGLNITTTFISLVFWSLIIGPLGAILAVPLTLFCKGILFDADPRTRWLPVFLGGHLDDVPPPETVPPLQAPPVVDDPELQPEPEVEPQAQGEPEPEGEPLPERETEPKREPEPEKA